MTTTDKVVIGSAAAIALGVVVIPRIIGAEFADAVAADNFVRADALGDAIFSAKRAVPVMLGLALLYACVTSTASPVSG